MWLADLKITYRGSVNRWECDENDHLNVRFFVQRHWQVLQGGLSALGISPTPTQLQSLHIRFLAEARIATPMTGYFGVVKSLSEDKLVVFSKLSHSLTGQCMSSALHSLDVGEVVLQSIPKDIFCEVDPELGPRGLSEEDSQYTALEYQELTAHNFSMIGKGTIGPEEVCRDGSLLIHHYMGRLSDSMPHLWMNLFGTSAESNSSQGGAVLEYRMGFSHFAKLGTNYEIWSGLAQAGKKVQQFTHLLFDADSYELILNAQAVGLRMDLETRKSVTLPNEVYERMKSQVLGPLPK